MKVTASEIKHITFHEMLVDQEEPTKEELLQQKIEQHLEEEENSHDEIIKEDSRRVD